MGAPLWDRVRVLVFKTGQRTMPPNIGLYENANVDDPFFMKNIFCTGHAQDDQFCAGYWADGQWIQAPQLTFVGTAELVEVLLEHLVGDQKPLPTDDVRAIRMAVALDSPVEGLKMLVECSQREL